MSSERREDVTRRRVDEEGEKEGEGSMRKEKQERMKDDKKKTR
jgi:hypothetical protein